VVDTIVWDMGGIFRVYFTELLVEMGRERGWPLERLPLGPTGPADDPAYRAMARGELHEHDYHDGVLAALAAEGIDVQPRSLPRSAYRARPEVWKVIEEVAARPDRHQAILTNDASAWLGDRWWETWPHREKFDALVDVADLGVRKPARAPYLAVLDRLGHDADRCVFVDDMPCNIAAAEDVGMTGVWFDITDPDGSVDRLRAAVGL
jgi:putative hydrolase of the HAD superfamily